MRIIIESNAVNVKSGTSQKTGNPWTRREQEGIAETERFRMPVRITLGDDQPPHAPGVYELDVDRSIQIGRWGDLEMARVPQLRRVGDLPKTRAAA